MARRRWTYDTIGQVMDGQNPFTQFGYTPKEKKRKVGDEWEDTKGKRWKKTENGIISVNKQADMIRELVRLRCSKCNMDIQSFGDRIDKQVHLKTGMCFDCLQVEEMKMKIDGIYKSYEERKIIQNKLSYLRDFRSNLVESVNYLKKDDSVLSLVTSQGDVVKWTGSQNADLLKIAEQDLVDVDKLILEVEQVVNLK